MANDGGITARIEQAMADVLAALQHSGNTVFRKAEPWNYQVDVTEGGKEAFSKYAPFAFPRYSPPVSAEREGGDLKQILQFAVCIGTENKTKGVARIGNATTLGISKIRDLVIDALKDWHPGAGFDCDNFSYYTDEQELEEPTRYALIMYFRANYITI